MTTILTLETENESGQTLTIDELTHLFSVLSHDLKSPIFSIDGFSDLLLSDYNGKLDEEGQDFLRRIRSSAQQMKRVLDEMSHLVKLLARPNARRPTPLREIIEEVVLKCNYQIEEGGVTVDIPGDLPTVDVDAEKMREAIGALFANALFFNDRPKGERTIAIDCTTEADRYRICVRDNGIGIDPRYTNQIFDLGLKLDKSRGGGPGYGLYLARHIIESHGGSITIESLPSQGSTVCFTIPSQQPAR
ncbi:MAG TPA: ATP-binding protein [Thermoanaerobaculia bacterium]|nr:ATP-binding protein [Thermoanaerobaculia bacterium]